MMGDELKSSQAIESADRPLILVTFDKSIGRRCWTPKQAVELVRHLHGMFGADTATVTVYQADGTVWSLHPTQYRAGSGKTSPYHWMNHYGAKVLADVELWPVYNDTLRRMLLIEPPEPEGGATAAAKPAALITGRYVLQPWVAMIPMMQQTVLMTALRGPDTLPKYGPAKYLLRWYRRCILLSAMDGKILSNPIEPNGGSFTGPSCTRKEAMAVWIREEEKREAQSSIVSDHSKRYASVSQMLDSEIWGPIMDDLVGDYLQNLDATPYHYHGHFMHGAQILGVHHPDLVIRRWWKAVYVRLVHELHLEPESDEAMNKRLGDNRDDWLARADVALSD